MFFRADVLLGATIPAIFQYLNNKRTSQTEKDKLIIQLRADIITKRRQEWIDSIRNSAKDLIAEFNLAYNAISAKRGNKSEEEMTALFTEIHRKRYLIQLHLNPLKEHQKMVIDAMDDINKALHKANSENNDSVKKEAASAYSNALDRLVEALTKVFQETWHKIKNLE